MHNKDAQNLHTLHQLLLGWSNHEGWDGEGT